MKTEKLMMVVNFKERQEAQDLGLKTIPEPQYKHTKFLFWKEDVKRVVVDGEAIIIDFYDEETVSLEYEEKTWKQLEKYFTTHED